MPAAVEWPLPKSGGVLRLTGYRLLQLPLATLAPAVSAVMLADACSAAGLALASYAVMLTDASAAAGLALFQ